MRKTTRYLTQTALMLALLIALQALTKGFGQLVTGSCVNGILAITALYCGFGSGVTVALLSPILAFLLGIAPQVLTVPAIMVGNTIYVALLAAIAGKGKASLLRCGIAWITAAAAKFAALYAIVTWLICGVFSQNLLDAGLLKAPMLKALPATFGIPQLITALIGGGIALAIVPLLKKALRK